MEGQGRAGQCVAGAAVTPPPLPNRVSAVARTLQAAGFRAYLVGGAVRDHLLGRPPHDHDLATDAPPERVAALLPGARSDDARFGRVGVGDVDVLTLRREGRYRDRRRPSEVVWTRSIRADLARRDFTVNAMAWDLDPAGGGLVDPWGGRADLEAGLLRAVGRPERRLAEDALRALRALRLRAELGFSYHPSLLRALGTAAAEDILADLAPERVREECTRALVAPGGGGALRDMRRLGLLPRILPECVPMVGCAQNNPMHLWDVWEHSVHAVEASAAVAHLRWAALLHDVGKPACRTLGPDGRTHFYGHEAVGEEIARAVLRRLRFPEAFVGAVASLVRRHMFSYGPETGRGAARRLVLALGPGGVRDLLELRRADRAASRWGRGYGPEGERLLGDLRAIEEAGERLALRDLGVSGHDVMAALGVEPGPAVGRVLRRLHQEVLDGRIPNRRSDLLTWLQRCAAAAPDPGAGP
jgi:putative nucleotidyltransferase with HDIG domain